MNSRDEVVQLYRRCPLKHRRQSRQKRGDQSHIVDGNLLDLQAFPEIVQNEQTKTRLGRLQSYERKDDHLRKLFKDIKNNMLESVKRILLEFILQQQQSQKMFIRMKAIELYLFGQTNLEHFLLQDIHLYAKCVVNIELAIVKKGLDYTWAQICNCIQSKESAFARNALCNSQGVKSEKVVIIFSAVEDMQIHTVSTLIKKLAEVNCSIIEVVCIFVRTSSVDYLEYPNFDSSVLSLLKLIPLKVGSVSEQINELLQSISGSLPDLQMSPALISHLVSKFYRQGLNCSAMEDQMRAAVLYHCLNNSCTDGKNYDCLEIVTILLIYLSAEVLGLKKNCLSLSQVWSGNLKENDLISIICRLENLQSCAPILERLNKLMKGNILDIIENIARDCDSSSCLKVQTKENRKVSKMSTHSSSSGISGVCLGKVLKWLFNNYYKCVAEQQDEGWMEFLQSIFDSSLRVEVHSRLTENMLSEMEDLNLGYQLLQNKGDNILTEQWKGEFQAQLNEENRFTEMLGGLKFMGLLKDNSRCKESTIQLLSFISQDA